MKKVILSVFSFASLLFTAQNLNPTVSISTPGSADTFSGGYTFAYATSGTPWNGALLSFGGFANQYDTQISANYFGNNISFRTKNGDTNTWNSWNELVTRGANKFIGNQSVHGNLGIGTDMISDKLTVYGEHIGSTILLHSLGGGTDKPANLTLWASEPQESFTGVGIGNNVRNYENNQSFTRIHLSNGGSYMRLLDNSINFNLISNAGVKKNIASFYDNRLEVKAKLHSVEGSDMGGGLVLENPSKSLGSIANKWAIYNMTGGYGNSLQFWSYSADGTVTEAKLKLSDNGNMALQGKLEAKELKVTLTPTADFVFDENYDLPELETVEKHIREKKHLPEIASAKEMEKEGVNVGEFQIKLLQKIEELTLYTIEQNKQLKKQAQEIKILKQQVNKKL